MRQNKITKEREIERGTEKDLDVQHVIIDIIPFISYT